MDKKYAEITIKELKCVLKTGRNVLVYGNKGEGKSYIGREYAKEQGLKYMSMSLAMEMPENIGGIPYVNTSSDYFIKILDKKIQPIIETEGKGYFLSFEEINQAPQEVMNALYGICHPDPEERNWNGHPLTYLQIYANGNLNDGSDGNVYLTDLPEPLEDRFYTFRLVHNDKDTIDFLSKKFKNIPDVKSYIKVMLENKINPRNIEQVLNNILCYIKATNDKKLTKNEEDINLGLDQLLKSKLGDSLAIKIKNMYNDIATIDPAQLIKNAKQAYKQFKEEKSIAIKKDDKTARITTDEEFKEYLSGMLSDEEIEAVMKGE